MSVRNRATVRHLLRQLNGLRQQIDEAIKSVDPTPPDHSFNCKGCGHSDWQHTNFAGGCVAIVPCNCAKMDNVSDCDHTYAKSCWCDHKQPDYIYCPKCGEKL